MNVSERDERRGRVSLENGRNEERKGLRGRGRGARFWGHFFFFLLLLLFYKPTIISIWFMLYKFVR